MRKEEQNATTIGRKSTSSTSREIDKIQGNISSIHSVI